MGTVLVGVLLLGILAWIVKGMIRDKKNGISLQCGGSCKNCGGCASAQHQNNTDEKK